MEICTIGFTKHCAREFFGILTAEGVEKLIDVRLNNVSQLAGFAKRDDLLYFLELHGIGYVHEPRLLAPTATRGRVDRASGSRCTPHRLTCLVAGAHRGSSSWTR